MARDNPRAGYPNLKPDAVIPTLKGFLDGDSIHVWCPYCNDFHLHSWQDGHPAMKHHRVAHCHDYVDNRGQLRPSQSPFKDTGYYIKPFSKADIRKIRMTVALQNKQMSNGA
jgi:hypothetical protein